MFDYVHLTALIAHVAAATTNNEKGDRFETLARYLFEHLAGVRVQEHDVNMQSEEIDLVLWNAKTEEVLEPWDPIILVECKNWSSNVGSQALDSFIAKLRRRSLKTGIFVAAMGVTGGYIRGDANEPGAAGIIRAALQEGIRVITITLADIQAIRTLDDIRELILKRYCGLYVHKVL